MADEEEPPPRLGTYVGTAFDVSCPGDHVNWAVVLEEGGKCFLECHPLLGQAKGGQPPWRAECAWEWDGCDELEVTVTHPDAVGPRKDKEFQIPVEDGALTFMKTKCVFEKPPVDTVGEQLAAMSAKELQAVAMTAGLDPAGCVEREDLERLLDRARANGIDVLTPAEKPKAPSSAPESPKSTSSPGSPKKAAAPESPKAAAEPANAAAEVAATPAAQAPAPAEQTTAAPENGAADNGVAHYTLEQLTEKHIWEKLDVKATERETYLADDVFQTVFGVSKAEFAKYPKWKKDTKKKEKGLF